MFHLSRTKRHGFTLIELLVVIAIIGILSTLAIVALSSARQKARDSKRVADISQITKALELYYNDNNSYPTLITPGMPLSDGVTSFLPQVPSSPTPWADGNCANKNYTYGASTGNSNYTLNFCTGDSVGVLPAGIHFATNIGLDADGSLAGWWKLNEETGLTAGDASGRSSVGTLTGSPTWTAASSCKVGACLSFDGTNAYVTLGTKRIGNILSGAPGASVAMWMKYAGLAGTAAKYDNVLFNAFSNGGGASLWLNVRGDSGNIGKILAGGRSITADSFQETTSSSVISSGTWTHVVGVVNYAVGRIEIYVNGSSVASTAVTFGSTTYVANGTPTSQDSISGFGTGGRFNGLIDDVRVYSRALSAAEVAALYNATN